MEGELLINIEHECFEGLQPGDLFDLIVTYNLLVSSVLLSIIKEEMLVEISQICLSSKMLRLWAERRVRFWRVLGLERAYSIFLYSLFFILVRKSLDLLYIGISLGVGVMFIMGR